MKNKTKYSESVKVLTNYLEQKEKDRQVWAKEKWSHDEGRLFKIGRVFMPIISIIGIFSMFIVCMLRFANIPQINTALANNGVGTNETSKEDPYIYFFFVLVLIAFNLLIFSSIKFIKGKYKKATYIFTGTNFVLSIFALMRLGADQNLFPDNSAYDGGPMFSYSEYCIFTAIVFGVAFVFSLIMITIYIKDHLEMNRIVDRRLINIIPAGKKTLLTEDDYADLINKYIEEDKDRIASKGKKVKNAKSTVFTDGQ